MDGMQLDVLLGVVKSFGLEIEEQAAFYKVASPPHIIHVSKPKSGMVRRIDLKGFDGVPHPALRVVTPDQARAGHLGKVTRQIDFERGEDEVLDCLRVCLSQMKPVAGGRRTEQKDSTTPVTMRLPNELLAAIELERKDIERSSPKGIEINLTSAIRVLLYEAVESRQKARSSR